MNALRAVRWLLRLGLGGVFVYAGVAKLRDPAGFAQEIANYQLWPAAAPYVAIALPAVEIVAGLAVLLLPGPWRRAGAVALGGMLAVFTVAVGTALARGIDISCGCFGTGSGPASGLTLARNLGLIALAAACVWLEGPRRPAIRYMQVPEIKA